MRRPATAPEEGSAPPRSMLTLAIDVGGTRLKAAVLDAEGQMLIGPVRTDTPHPGGPAEVLGELEKMVSGLGTFDRISIGFPGVVRRGRVFTAPNLGSQAWHDYPLVAEASRRFGKPARLLNDATVQGLGVIAGEGLELVVTLGTGFGFALFHEGRMSPQLEVGQHEARKGKNYDHYVGSAALSEVGPKKWNRRMVRVIDAMRTLTMFDALLIGGGNAKHITFELPERVRLVDNAAGITGGVKLWAPRYEENFAHDDV